MSSILYNVYQHPLLDIEEMQKIHKFHQKTELKKGDFLLKEGNVADEYYIIEKGLVRSYVLDYDNNDITTDFFTEGEIVIAPSSLFQRIPSQENIQTMTDCTLWKIEYNAFQELFHNIEGFREWGRVWFSYQLFNMKQRSLDMITLTAKDRYLKLLKEKPNVFQNAPLKQIATFLGITDTSLSRIRKEIL